MALAVSKAENFTRQCDRFGKNTNGTRDWGVFQLNEVHLKKGYTIKDFTDCQKNIEIAYKIFKQQSWNPWVAFTNGNYKKYLN